MAETSMPASPGRRGRRSEPEGSSRPQQASSAVSSAAVDLLSSVIPDPSQPAQQESPERSLSKAWAASLRASTVVR